MKRRFATLDVFTDTRLAGNPLAVVLDSDGLDADGMLAIAREFNLSETVFVLPPEDPVNLKRIRIFTPGGELPFAGHPTVGSSVCLAFERGVAKGQHVDIGLEVQIGTITCTVRVFDESVGHSWFYLPSLPVEAGDAATMEAIAEALGITPGEIGFGAHRPTRFKMGPTFTFVPVANRDVLSRVTINSAKWSAAFNTDIHRAAYIYTEGDGVPAYHARMFSPGMGFSEDPATGSASAALSQVLMRFEKFSDEDRIVEIEQGRDMGRPSRILLGLQIRGGALDGVSIGGDAVLVSEGHIFA